MSVTRRTRGGQIVGWPTTVISRGRIVVADDALHVERGSGEFLPCAAPGGRSPRPPAAEIARLANLRRQRDFLNAFL